MVGFPHIILFFALCVVPLGCVINWYFGLQTLQRGLPLIEYRKRDTVSWGLIDLGVAIIVLAGIVGVGLAIVNGIAGINAGEDTSTLSPGQQSALFFGFGTSTLLGTALTLGWLWARYQRLDGLSFSYLGKDIELGTRWFMMLIVPVIMIQFVLSMWFPSNHPLVEMLRESGDLSFLPVAAFAAVVSAPIFEEIFFRLLLQGWMEKLQIARKRTSLGLGSSAERSVVLIGGSLESVAAGVSMQSSEEVPAIDEESHPAVSSDNPYASSVRNVPVEDEPLASRPVMWVPILVSSALFALAHLGHGPDWVALFLLAIGLGYLYQRTGRILPSMIVHFLVNSLAMMQLWAAVLQP